MTINNKLIIFQISETQSLIIKNLCYQGNHLYRWDPIEIIFKDKNIEYIINQHDYLMPKIEDIYYYLQSVIKNKLCLSKSLKGNIGYLRNQDSEQNNISISEKHKKLLKKKLPIYIMWGGNKFETWLYNQNNKIYLEIIPLYEWAYRDPEEGEKFIPFDEWIENYKPLAVIEIDKATAQQWLEQTKMLMKEIEKSDEKYLHTPQEEIEE